MLRQIPVDFSVIGAAGSFAGRRTFEFAGARIGRIPIGIHDARAEHPAIRHVDDPGPLSLVMADVLAIDLEVCVCGVVWCGVGV